MHEILVNRLGGLSLPRKSVVRLTDRPDMTLDVYCGRKTTMQHIIFLFGKIYLSILAFISVCTGRSYYVITERAHMVVFILTSKM